MSRIVVMGVSGCGKTSVAAALAHATNLPLVEGDSLHAPASIAKMVAGMPLVDADRWDWIDRIGTELATRPGAIATCSALRRVYRDRLRDRVGPSLRFVMLDLSRAELERRMQARQGHFMPATLLDSQLATLESPADEPGVVVVDGEWDLDAIVADICGRLRLLSPEGV